MKVLKIIVNVILIILCFSSTWHGVTEFNAATTWLEVFRGAFWFILGWIAIFVLIDKIKENKWPIQ